MLTVSFNIKLFQTWAYICFGPMPNRACQYGWMDGTYTSLMHTTALHYHVSGTRFDCGRGGVDPGRLGYRRRGSQHPCSARRHLGFRRGCCRGSYRFRGGGSDREHDSNYGSGNWRRYHHRLRLPCQCRGSRIGRNDPISKLLLPFPHSMHLFGILSKVILQTGLGPFFTPF